MFRPALQAELRAEGSGCMSPDLGVGGISECLPTGEYLSRDLCAGTLLSPVGRPYASYDTNPDARLTYRKVSW